ncbi:MAG: UbiA family prenyltransferase [Bacteroidetes bacterium]|nr:UbiA family prenyltransferase [Bacteroidota bacterium]
MKSSAVIPFFRAYVKSMRLYYSFITGLAGLVGVTYYQYVAHAPGRIALSEVLRSVERPTPPLQMALILVILFLAWGINQIVNDWLGLEEDRINAPARPMVTGELHPGLALLLSAVLMTGAGAVAWFFLEPLSVVALVAGVALNVVYEYAKGHGIWGNVVFGVMISCCAAFGFMASGPSEASILTTARTSMLGFVALINGVMTFYTYFKDYEGDKAAGKQTLVVRYGLQRSRYASLFAAFLPSVVFVAGYAAFDAWPIALNGVFLLLAALTVLLQVWTGWLYFRNPRGDVTYYALSFNFRACACAEAALIALFNPTLGILLFFLTYMLVAFLFNFHVNRHG